MNNTFRPSWSKSVLDKDSEDVRSLQGTVVSGC